MLTNVWGYEQTKRMYVRMCVCVHACVRVGEREGGKVLFICCFPCYLIFFVIIMDMLLMTL
jgi:hypothetical protein